MIEWIMGLYQSVLNQTAHMPQAQAALITISSVSIAGLIGFLLIKLPKAIGNFFRGQCMTSLTFNTSGSTWGDYNQMQYTAFLKWFSKNAWFNWSRIITIDGESRNELGAVGPGVGTHIFIFKRRFFFFRITEKDSQGTHLSKYNISISVIGRSKQPLYDLMNAFMDQVDPTNYITMFDANERDWSWITRMEKRRAGTMVIQKNVQEELFEPLKEFVNNREWYLERGLDYKFCSLLYGPPGTGKSSIAREVANVLGRDLYKMSPDGDISYTSLFQKAKGGVVLIEDIDAFGVARKRTSAVTDVEAGIAVPTTKVSSGSSLTPIKVEDDSDKGDSFGDALSEYLGGSLSELLNGLQGVIPLDDVIVLITTNHPEKLDPALIRDGRVDRRILVDYFSHEDIVKYIKLMYKTDYDGETLPPLPVATVSKHFLDNKWSVEKFIEALLSLKEDNVFMLNASGE